MLAKFRAAKEAEIADLRRRASQGLLVAPLDASQRTGFADALKDRESIAIIAEYKRASPSLGVIRTDLEVEDVARKYQNGGAAAISVLTEERYFDGRLSYIDRARTASALPVLRKDFIFDELQITATAATRASAILLIARMLPEPGLLRKMRELAESYGLDAVIEVFDIADLNLAREAGAKAIQVNARDLQKLQVDKDRPLKLAEEGEPRGEEIWIAASGINDSEQLRRVHEAGYRAALIGSFLMARGDPAVNLISLKGA